MHSDMSITQIRMMLKNISAYFFNLTISGDAYKRYNGEKSVVIFFCPAKRYHFSNEVNASVTQRSGAIPTMPGHLQAELGWTIKTLIIYDIIYCFHIFFMSQNHLVFQSKFFRRASLITTNM